MAAIRQIEDRMVLRNFFTAGDGTIVDTSTRNIQALDDAGATTTEPTFVVSYADTNGSTLTLATNVGSLNGTTPVDLIGAPTSGSQRAISEISIYNADSVQHTITIRLLDNATPYIIGKFVVPPSYTLFYDPSFGWRVSNGATVGGGTVTSVGLTVPGVLFTSPVSGSPVTGAGTFALALKTQIQNTFLAGPTSGADATPTFRAIVAADVPDLSATYQPLDSDLSALANNSTNGMWARTGAGTGSARTLAASSPLSMANGDGVAGAPTVSFADQTANTVLAGPTSGGAAGPAFRTLVAADVPDLGANPSASVGIVAVNGAAATFLRSDAAPPLDQGIVPTWTGIHTFSNQLKLANGSASAPELAFNTNYGFFYDTTNVGIGVSVAGVQTGYFIANNQIFEVISGSGNPNTLSIRGESSTSVNVRRASANSNGPAVQYQKARGTLGSLTVPNLLDVLGSFNFQGYNGAGAFTNGASFGAALIESGTVSATAMGSRLFFSAAAIGAGTLTEIARYEVATGFSMFGANPVIDQNRVFRPRSYAVASVPAVTATGIIEFSDEAGRAALGYTDGVAWRRVGDNQVASATVDYRGVWSNLSARSSSTLLTAIQNAYQKLSDASLLTKLKGLWVHAMPNQADALLNWITPGTRDLTITGSPTFTANIGFTGDGSTALLTTGVTPATFGLAQNDSCYGTFVLTASGSAAAVIGKTSGTRNLYFQSAGSGALITRCNDATNDNFTPTRYTGMFAMSRSLSTGYNASVDDAAATAITRTSTALSAGNITFLGTTDATGSEFSTAQIAYSFVATSLAAADLANLSSIMGEFLETIGAITYSVSHLPPAANFKNRAIFVSDLGGGAGSLRSDGTNWRRENGFGYEARTLATGGETLTPLTNASFVEYTQTLSGNVTVTLSATDAKGTAVAKGAWFTITHNNGTPGAFTFAIANGGGGGGTLITFASATNKSATCVFDGTNWRLMSDAAI